MNKKLISLLLLFAFGILTSSVCLAKAKQMKLRVLYLGGQSDWAHGEMGGANHFKSDADFQKSVEDRTAAFANLLNTYFTTVKAMPAKDWKPEMSNDYDVTIFDGVPPILNTTEKEYNFQGNIQKMKVKHYLPQDFTCASITIGKIAETIGRPYGSKNDWLCLCLDADAHSMNLQHAIFKGPFKTAITQTKEPTPEDAFHYAYFMDGNVPDSVMMWKVNTVGYKTNHEFNIGMVSRPWGYTDSPDCEYISSGVCAKTLNSVALGRHANFFTWGFSGSPLYMTDEAKVVFANAVAYMAKHHGTPLVRKYNDRIATREYLKEVNYYNTRKAWQVGEERNKMFFTRMIEMGKKAREKQAKGEELDNEEKFYLKYTEKDMPKGKTFEEYMKDRNPELFDKFGTDETKYKQYYDENTPYFYGGQGSYNLVIDADAKAWGIANNDKRILEKAITCLEKNEEVERAKRILSKYTLCEFTTPTEWRKWYNTYKNKIFFTESGGWYFMVNDKNAPSNDYTVAEKRKVQQQTNTFKNNMQVSHENPLAVNASVVKLDRGGIDIVFDIKLMSGYHVYRTVDAEDPYIPMSIHFTLPEGAVLGEVSYPMAKPFVKDGTTIYEGDTTIRQNVKLSSVPATIKCTFECQCCDANVCMPPFNKEFTLNVE